MLNYTSSSWFPLYKFKVGFGECDHDFMLGLSTYSGIKDYLTGEKIKKFTTVIWSRKFNINIILDNYLKLKNSNNNDIIDKLSKINLNCDLKI